MTRIGDTARVRRSGSHVDHTSPIESQAVEVYQAARKLAVANHFKKHVHNGPLGPVSGVAGPMVLTRLVRQLFPGYNEEEFKTAYSIINQALRKTDSLVCLRRPAGDPQHRDPKDMPIWFVRDKMSDRLVIVTLAQAKKSADVTERLSSFDEDKFLTKREKRLSKEAVGEHLPPGEVTVKTGPAREKTSDDLRAEALAAQRDKVKREHAQFKARVLEEIQTNPVPLTTQDLYALLKDGDEFGFHHTTYRDVVKELSEEGLIVARKETDDERRVRGGGSLPKGGRSNLWAPAPGPVPNRTRLPDGVAPYKSAQDWDDAKRDQREKDMLRILEFIRTEHRDRRRRQRMIASLDLTDERFNSAIRELESQGQVYSNQGRFYVRRHSTKTTAPEKENPLPTQTDPVTVPTTPSPASPAGPGDEGDLELVKRLADKLGVQLPQGDATRIQELETENARLKEQVAALKAAVAALA